MKYVPIPDPPRADAENPAWPNEASVPSRHTSSARPRDLAAEQQAPPPADSPYVLGWACARGSGRRIGDAACLVRLLCKRLRDDAEDEGDHEHFVNAAYEDET